MKNTLETRLLSGLVLMVSNDGRMVCCVVCMAPDTMPSASPVRPSSSPEQSMPWLSVPAMVVMSMCRSPGSTDPGRATGTRWPASMLVAPQTMESSSPPTAVRTRVSESFCELGWGATSSSSPTTTPCQSEPTRSMALTSMPSSVSRSASSSGVSSTSTNSRSQESGTRIYSRFADGEHDGRERGDDRVTLPAQIFIVQDPELGDVRQDLIERLEEIHQAIPEVPLVLHGSSGVKEDSVVESLGHGIAKVNVATYLSQAFTYAMFDNLKANPNVEDPRKHLVPAREAAKERVRAKIRLFRSAGTVSSSGGFKSPPTQHRVADIGEAE